MITAECGDSNGSRQEANELTSWIEVRRQMNLVGQRLTNLSQEMMRDTATSWNKLNKDLHATKNVHQAD